MSSITTNTILAQQVALESWTNVIANDLSNINTDGYEGKDVIFSQFSTYLDGSEQSNMVEDYGIYRNTKVGAVEKTNNDFDLALVSKGDYYGIQTENGVRYTRKSHFILDKVIKDDMGNALLSQDGGEIAIPPGSIISVDTKGRIFDQYGEFISQLQIVNFGENTQALKEEAGPYFSAEDIAPIPSETPRVQQKYILNSNVSTHEKMRDMMLVSKLYQNGNRILKEETDQINRLIELIN